LRGLREAWGRDNDSLRPQAVWWSRFASRRPHLCVLRIRNSLRWTLCTTTRWSEGRSCLVGVPSIVYDFPTTVSLSTPDFDELAFFEYTLFTSQFEAVSSDHVRDVTGTLDYVCFEYDRAVAWDRLEESGDCLAPAHRGGGGWQGHRLSVIVRGGIFAPILGSVGDGQGRFLCSLD